MENSSKSLHNTGSLTLAEAMAKVESNTRDIKDMSPRERFLAVKNARAAGKDWQSIYDNIRQVVDHMDVKTDTEIFGVEIPWDFWR